MRLQNKEQHFFQNLELKSLMKWMVIVLIGLFIASQIVFLWVNVRSRQGAKVEYLKNRIDQLQTQTELLFTTISSSGNAISYSDMAKKYATTKKIAARMSLANNLELLMDAVTISGTSIQSIFYTNFDIVHIGSADAVSFLIKKQLQENMESAGWTPRQRNLTYTIYGKDIQVCITPSYIQNGKYCYTVITYDLSRFEPYIRNSEHQEIETVILLGSQNDILYQNHQVTSEEMELVQNALLKKPNGGFFESDGTMIAVTDIHDALGWRWVATVPGAVVWSEMSGLLLFTIMMNGVMLLLLLGYSAVLKRNISDPINAIVHFVDTLGNRYSTRRLHISHQNEIGMVAEVINRMLDNIDHVNQDMSQTQNKVFELEIAQKQTELNALRSQINPHFLYNTLDCVRSIALVKEVPEIVYITTYMSDIFRYSIKGQNFVKLKDEMECINEYIGIMQIRHSNRFKIQIDFADGLEELYIPRMILQPIVENAVFHGLERTRKQAVLIISGWLLPGDQLRILVSDNGLGMTTEVLSQLQIAINSTKESDMKALNDKQSIGLGNINHRIRLLYGAGYGLSIDSSPENGTSVTVLLPVMNSDSVY